MIALVHGPTLRSGIGHHFTTDKRVDIDNANYFRMNWDSDDYPRPSNSCADNACSVVGDGCVCNLSIIESQVFPSLPSAENILSQLHLGSVEPSILGSYTEVFGSGDVEVWHKNGNGYSQDTVFGVTYRGKKTFLKNMRSTIEIQGASEFQFRNPPHHLNVAVREPRDAAYETDAVLESYFYHDNVAPFLALRIIQRFGISNPSPRYMEAVATAFRDGIYTKNGHIFGDNKYGNLGALLASVVLDREARVELLDADPTFGSLKEQMMKVIAFMRAMEFKSRDDAGKEIRLDLLQDKIGQEPHSSPGVFSFFLPEYAAPGSIKAALLTSPEAQLLSGPKIIGLMNGIISLVDLGLTECFGGFAQRNLWNCDRLQPNDYYNTDDDRFSMGKLNFVPSNPYDSVSVVNELSLLLTDGRLNQDSRSVVANAYASAPNNADGLRLAQKLISSTPEFQSNNVFNNKADLRPEVTFPDPSGERYKAILYLKLDGGVDSFNVLVPHSGCSGGKSKSCHKLYIYCVVSILSLSKSLT